MNCWKLFELVKPQVEPINPHKPAVVLPCAARGTIKATTRPGWFITRREIPDRAEPPFETIADAARIASSSLSHALSLKFRCPDDLPWLPGASSSCPPRVQSGVQPRVSAFTRNALYHMATCPWAILHEGCFQALDVFFVKLQWFLIILVHFQRQLRLLGLWHFSQTTSSLINRRSWFLASSVSATSKV